MFLYLFHPFGFVSLLPFLWVLRCASWFIVLCAGLGFVTSLLFVFLVGVFVSSWLGATVFWIGEWFIKRMPFVRHLYSASKQISSAISPGKEKITCLICLHFICRNDSKCKSCMCYSTDKLEIVTATKLSWALSLFVAVLIIYVCLSFILYVHCRPKYYCF